MMKRRTKIIIASIISFVLFLVVGISIYAYYEYYGQYRTVLNIDGTIKLDAFDVLYPELRKDSSYGKTPDNPYVIDNVTRLKNLIKLNNAGKLEKSKLKDGVDKYYFCLQFDCQEVQQVLNLSSEGDFESIGNNEYPFVDELAGVVYAAELTTGNYVYYSGCLPQIDAKADTQHTGKLIVTYNGADIYYYGAEGYNPDCYLNDSNVLYLNGTSTGLTISAGSYLLTQYRYDSSNFTAGQPESVKFESYTPTYGLLNRTNTTLINQMISNQTIVATDSQADVGFISSIGNGGYVHDLILNNLTIKCVEDSPKSFMSVFKDILDALTGHQTKRVNKADERHIGFFTGHMEEGSNANNISIAGESNFVIDTKSVNYFSNFTTVGYIDENALIGGKLFSEVAKDNTTDGDIGGVLWADNIYQCVENSATPVGSTGRDNDQQYTLVSVDSGDGWPGTDGSTFKYGSFTFLLSANNDTVSNIWNSSNNKYLLGDNNYTITGSVLYCTDEYRYQANNGINQTAASVKETIYNGITKLENSGNVIDQGKYIIVAHVGNRYYALKIAAIEDSSGVSYYFDTTDKIDVTDFLNGDGTLYQSALWEVSEPSATPTFKNCRFESEYFKGYASTSAFTAANNLTNAAGATQFGVNLNDDTFYFDYNDNGVYTRYFLNFNSADNEFYFDDSSNTTIELYKITDGYNLEKETNYNGITDLGSYLIIAGNGTNYYLLGVDYDEAAQTVLTAFDADLLSTTISGLAQGLNTPVTMTSAEYQTYLNYIWRADKVGNNGLTFIDKISSSLYLSHTNANLTLSGNALTWTYATANATTDTCNLLNGGYYLTYNANLETTTKFGCTQTNPNYNIYLYEITPQDETPPYITYDGARYLDAEASTIEVGTYAVIATDETGEQYAIGMSGNTISKTNRFVQTTTYNSLYTYYSRSGLGTTESPYVYTPETISEYTQINNITNQASLNAAISTYGTVYRMNTTYQYEVAFSTSSNTTYYYLNGNTYGNARTTTTFTRGNTYYTRNGTQNNTFFSAFEVKNNVIYYSDQNGTVATNFTRGNTYYTRKETINYVSVNNYNNTYSYYYFTLDSNEIHYYYDYLYNSGSDYFTWNVFDSTNSSVVTTASPLFKNSHNTTYYLNGTTVSTNSSIVYYDAINQQVFYYDNGEIRYVYVNNNGSIVSNNALPSETKVSLYKVNSKYIYNNVERITSGMNSFQNINKVFFISTGELTNSSNNSYLIGKNNPLSASFEGSTNKNYTAIDYYSMANNYTYNSGTITTTEDLDNFTWLYDSSVSNASAYTNLYLSGYETVKGNSNYHYYIGVSSVGGKRDMVITKRVNPNFNTSINNNDYNNTTPWYGGQNATGVGGSYSITGFWTGYVNNVFGIIFKGGGNSYFMVKGDTDRSMTIGTYSSNITPYLNLTGNYETPYFYSSDKPISSKSLTLISSDGDSLEENIHYAIAAKSGDDYYAMTYDPEKSTSIYGTDMTTQYDLIKDVGTYTSFTTIPSNCDWIQMSNNQELRFNHYITSTDSSLNYLNFIANNVGIRNITSADSYTIVQSSHYDIVNKILSYKIGNNTYYVTYNRVTNIFSSSTNISDAATIELLRYTPSYLIERVKTLNDSLDSGQYIFAGHSVNGYTALGTNGNLLFDDLTNELTSYLSEEAYLNIQEYIFNQVYYSNIAGSNYNTDVSSNYVNFLLENAANLSSFVSYSTEFKTYSSSAKWRLYVDSNGMWKMVSYEKMGTENGGQYGINFTASSTTSNLKIVDTYLANVSYISGVNNVSSSDADGKQIAFYNVNDLTTAVTSITSGNSYAVFVKNGTYWYLLYLNGTSLASVQVGKNLNDLASKLNTVANGYNYTITASAGPTDGGLTYGNYLYFTNGNTKYYLTGSGTTLNVTTSQQTAVTNQTMHWVYNYDEIYINKSTLCTVTKATVNNNLGVSGYTVTPTGSATYVYTVNNDNSLGNIATSITNSTKYAIVIFLDGNYYIVSRESANSTNVTYESYGSGLPISVSEYQIFNGVSVATNQYSFTQTVGGNVNYLVMDVNRTLTLSTTRGNCYFSYSGSNPSATPSVPTREATNSCTFSWYLFRVVKNDKLDSSTDVTVTLTGHDRVTASLSVIQSDDYVIVAEANGAYYALTMTDYDTIVSLDITDTMEEALDGGNIRLYKASVFEQLGSEYSLIFNSEAFAGSFYYLLDGTYENRVDNHPVVTPEELFDTTETYYTLEAQVVKDDISSTIGEGEYYYFTSGCYVRASEYVNSFVYYTLIETIQTGIEHFEENKTYYTKHSSGYSKAYEYKDGVSYYKYDANTSTYVLDSTVNSTNFGNDTYYLQLVNPSYVGVSSKTTDISNISDNYKWTIYTYASQGRSGYVFGYYDDLQSNISYVYYNSSDRMFELTTDIETAIASNSLVQIYRLGKEINNVETFKTFNIYLEQDNVTIISFPLNTVTDVNEIKTYSSSVEDEVVQENGTNMSVIPGEYLFAIKDGDYYYTITMNSEYELSYYDITLLFDGNYIKDDNGYYCISINTKYLWNQVIGSNVFTINGNSISGLQFENCGYSGHKMNNGGTFNITLNITDNSTGAATISCNGQYLAFTSGTGFSWTNSEANAVTVYMYSVGATAKAVSEEEVLSYTYYSQNVNALNYSYFNFEKYHTPDLPNYASAFGYYDYTTGWLLTNNEKLSEINASVYFKDGATSTFNNNLEYAYTYVSPEGEAQLVTQDYNLTYSAPGGVAAFVITEATPEIPVYVNAVVTTQLATRDQSNNYVNQLNRYLALWHMADLDYASGTLYKVGTDTVMTSALYESVFNENKLTPFAAIPLANHYDTREGTLSTSLVKVSGESYYLENYGYDHLIAHTFVVTEPGVYYLGSTSGSIAFSYLSIDRMRTTDPNEDDSMNISEDFTIDYIAGAAGTTTGGSPYAMTNASPFYNNTNVGTLAPVGSSGWYHSNIYPEFINGTAGMIEPESGVTYYEFDVDEIVRITRFEDGVTYYTKDGNTYTEVASDAEFVTSNDYYVLTGGNYELVHKGDFTSGSYYTIEVFDGVTTFTEVATPQINGKYYTIDMTAANVSNGFDPAKAYYKLVDGEYVLVYNPVDYMEMHISRTVNGDYSTINVNYKTTEEIYNLGYGVTYINSNKNALRTYRRISLNYIAVNEANYTPKEAWDTSTTD